MEFTSQLWIFKIVTINVYGHIANRCITHHRKSKNFKKKFKYFIKFQNFHIFLKISKISKISKNFLRFSKCFQNTGFTMNIHIGPHISPRISTGLENWHSELAVSTIQITPYHHKIYDNVGEFLIDVSRLFQSETVDEINELADVLSLHLGGT